jgi:hypothetical protein
MSDFGGDEDRELRDGQCCGAKISHWIVGIGVVAIICILLTMGALVAGIVLGTQKDSLHRIGIHSAASEVVGAAGEGAFRSDGLLELDETDNAFRWSLTTETTMTTVTALVIRGPYAAGTRLGPVAGVLCGAVLMGPSQACDTLSAPGYVNGAVAFQIADNVSPGGIDVRPLLHAIRENCHLYYLETLTNAKPVTPGAMRSSLCEFAGWK